MMKSIDIKEGLAGKYSKEVFGALVPSDRIVNKAGDDIKGCTIIN